MANSFPRWTNTLPLKLLVCFLFLGAGIAGAVTYYFTQKYTRVGYMPSQPIPFSHQIHAGQLGMDCRYCHSFVEKSGHANVPTSSTCWNCHQHVKTNSPHIALIKESVETGKPIEWVKVHNTPDYAYFNHSAHVTAGVSCVSCHGKINEMPVEHGLVPGLSSGSGKAPPPDGQDHKSRLDGQIRRQGPSLNGSETKGSLAH